MSHTQLNELRCTPQRGFRNAFSLLRTVLAAAVLTVCLHPALHAQLNTATLQGVSRDASGAVIPNATIAVLNTETGIAKTTTSGDHGEFYIPFLQPGLYEITVRHAGFETSKETGIRLEVGQQANLDFTLLVGGVSDTVTVASTLYEIPNSDTTLGTVIGQKQVVDLPLKRTSIFPVDPAGTGRSTDRQLAECRKSAQLWCRSSESER